MLEFLRKAAPIVGILAVFIFGWHLGSSSKDHDWKEVVHNEYVKKTEARKATQGSLNEISEKYQEDYAALEGSTDRIIADLRDSNKRLLVRIKNTSGTSGPDGRCIVDGPVELHETTSRRLIEITEKADLKEKALQDTIRKLQQKEK